jgi:hypothetical protein
LRRLPHLLLVFFAVLYCGYCADWLSVCGGQIAMNSDRSTAEQTVGNQYATHVLATLERHVSVIARIRHRVHLGNYKLTGSGRYWQQGVGIQRKTRLLLQTQIANQTASLIQVFDGRYLWTDQQLPSGRKVTRLDPASMQAGLTGGSTPITRQGKTTSATTLLSAAASRGSFCGQLADLIQQFDFTDPQSIQLHGVPRVALIGHWKMAQLARVWPGGIKDPTATIRSLDQGQTAEELLVRWPSQLPHHVLLLVGPQNLYPFLIEYRQAIDAPLASTPAGMQPTQDPLARYEHFKVQFAAQIDDQLFEMANRDIDWTDETPQRIKQLKALMR